MDIPFSDPASAIAAAAVLAHVVGANVVFLGARIADALAIINLGVAKSADHASRLQQ